MQGTRTTPNTSTKTNGTSPKAAKRGQWVDLLESLLGKTVTIVNPESYEEAPVGHQLRAGFYRARPVGIGKDFLMIATEFVHSRGSGEKEGVRQYIPFSQIKRVSVMKSEVLIHL